LRKSCEKDALPVLNAAGLWLKRGARRLQREKIFNLKQRRRQNSQAAVRSAISQSPADATIQIDQQRASGKGCAAGTRSNSAKEKSEETLDNAVTLNAPPN
jgi:hypothetical protein